MVDWVGEVDPKGMVLGIGEWLSEEEPTPPNLQYCLDVLLLIL